jgi:class 3 adenylate cyclase
MGLKDDLEKEVAEIFKAAWSERDGTVVPTDDSVKLGNDAVKLSATVLYADLADSTKLVDGHTKQFSAEIYKTFLHCAAKIIRSEDGAITAYDGDRVMAVFIGDRKNSRAAKTALSINWAMHNIVVSAKSKQYPDKGFVPKHVVGIDTSDLYVARTGVRGANDFVWVGRAANYAAKLAALPESHVSYITKEVFDALASDAKTSSDGRAMWEAVKWNTFDNRTIYRSSWSWKFT